MAAVVTSVAGAGHISERVLGSPLTNTFDAIELGQGNNAPTTGDTRASMTAKIGSSLIQVASGYPLINDTDIRNEGRGASVYTWKFVYPEGIQILASNLIVTNYAGGAPAAGEAVMVSADQVLVKRTDQELTVFVNVSTAYAATIVAHIEDGTPLVEQLATWRQQSIVLSGSPGASPVTNGVVQSRLTEGEQAWTGARLLDGFGAVLTRTGVASARLLALRRSREREWETGADVPLPVDAVMMPAPVRTDPRWRGTQGYTFAHAWVPPAGWGARRTRLEYALTLTTGEQRTLVHEIEWASLRTS